MSNDPAEDGKVASVRDKLRFDQADGTYHLAVDTRTESISTSIVVAVAEVLDRDPTQLDPLSTRLDPDALDGLFEGPGTEATREGLVRFTFVDCLISVYATGDVVIEPPADHPARDRR